MRLIHDNLLFHNVGELFPAGGAGLRIQRLPESLRLRLNANAQDRMLFPVNSEIRFVANPGDEVELTLRAPHGGMIAAVFWGNVLCDEPHRIADEPTTIKLRMPERMAVLGDKINSRGGFAWNVCRVVFTKRPTYGPGKELYYLGRGGAEVRPPMAGEMPRRKWLAYGTSITQGSLASQPYLSWVALTARELGVDLVNLGSGGSCHCEPEKADYMSELDWDFATLCLSVNMLNAFTEEEFRERVEYVVDRIASSKPDKPVICITIMTFHADLNGVPEKADRFREILRVTIRKLGYANLHLVEGQDLILDASDLTGDLIHPSDLGMMKVSQRILEKITPIVGRDCC